MIYIHKLSACIILACNTHYAQDIGHFMAYYKNKVGPKCLFLCYAILSTKIVCYILCITMLLSCGGAKSLNQFVSRIKSMKTCLQLRDLRSPDVYVCLIMLMDFETKKYYSNR